MKYKWGIIIFGLIEIAIGSITLVAVIASLILGESRKPPEVLIFVLTTSTLSLSLGIGIIKGNLTSYHLLLFFATIIVLSKILIFAKIISLSGTLETTLPASIKNIISIVYHAFLTWYFTRRGARKYFKERRNVLFSLPWPTFKK